MGGHGRPVSGPEQFLGRKFSEVGRLPRPLQSRARVRILGKSLMHAACRKVRPESGNLGLHVSTSWWSEVSGREYCADFTGFLPGFMHRTILGAEARIVMLSGGCWCAYVTHGLGSGGQWWGWFLGWPSATGHPRINCHCYHVRPLTMPNALVSRDPKS